MKEFLVILLIAAVAFVVVIFKTNSDNNARYQAELNAQNDHDMRIVTNCENAVRSQADKATLRFGDVLGNVSSKMQPTDAGFLYYVQASDSTVTKTLSIACYTDKAGNVLRMVY